MSKTFDLKLKQTTPTTIENCKTFADLFLWLNTNYKTEDAQLGMFGVIITEYLKKHITQYAKPRNISEHN